MLDRRKHLFRNFPSARRSVKELSSFFEDPIAIQSNGLNAVERAFGGICDDWNRKVETMPLDTRPEVGRWMYEVHDEVARQAAFERHGRITFLLGKDVQSELARTDATGVRVGDIKAPFSAFYVGLNGGSHRKNGDVLEGFWVRDSIRAIGISLCYRWSDGRKHFHFGPVRSVIFERCEEQLLSDALAVEARRLAKQAVGLRQELEQRATDVPGAIVRHVTSAEAEVAEYSEKFDQIAEDFAFAANVLCLLSAQPDAVKIEERFHPSGGLIADATAKKREDLARKGEIHVRTLHLRQDTSGHKSGLVTGRKAVSANRVGSHFVLMHQ